MSVSRSVLIALAIILPLASGCSAKFGRSARVTPEIRVQQPEKANMQAWALAQLQLGRDALADEQYAKAIIAFRNARLASGETAAALNGMAIAYAGIGRADLAENYFQQAIAEAPDNLRYRDNLQRLYDATPRMAAAASEEIAPLNVAQPAPTIFAGSDVRATIRVEQPVARLTRTSDRGVSIATVRVASAQSSLTPLPTPTAGHGVSAPGTGRRLNPTYAGSVILSTSEVNAIRQPNPFYAAHIRAPILLSSGPARGALQPRPNGSVHLKFASAD